MATLDKLSTITRILVPLGRREFDERVSRDALVRQVPRRDTSRVDDRCFGCSRISQRPNGHALAEVEFGEADGLQQSLLNT